MARLQSALTAWLLATIASAANLPAHAAAIDLTQPGTVFESAPYTLGFGFTPTTDVRLVGLGVFDHLRDGLEAPAEVALWAEAGAAPLRSTGVAGGTAASLEGDFRFQPVAPLLLKAGQAYVIGAYLDGGWATSFETGQGGQASVDSRVQLLGDRYADGFFAITYPGQSDGMPGAWLGANFQLAAVPEPTAAALLAIGLAALAWRRRR